MFFGYDASVRRVLKKILWRKESWFTDCLIQVMSQVNTNKDYLRLMGAASGSDRDSAAVGGIVSVWFGGFAIGEVKSTRIGKNSKLRAA